MTDQERQPLIVLSQLDAHADIKQSSCFTRFFSRVPARYGLVFASALGFFGIYSLRLDLSLAILAIVDSETSLQNATTHHHAKYDWTSEQQGFILSSFFYGYIITQIPGGYLATKFGGRYTFGLPILVTALLTLLTPIAADVNYNVLIAVRFLEGLFEGLTFPAMFEMLGEWCPPKERTVMSILANSGIYLGTIFTFPLSALLCQYGFDGGWSSVFYVFGIFGIISFILWLFLGFDSPKKHPWISRKERELIEKGIQQDMIEHQDAGANKIPWFQIFTSQPVWGIIIATISVNWTFTVLIICIPSFFSDAFNLTKGKDLIQNGLLSCMPYIVYLFSSLTCGVVADLLQRRTKISVIAIRKGFEIGGLLMGAVALLCLGFFDVDKILSVVLLTVSVSLGGLLDVGHSVNVLDIAPQYAGIVYGITNTFGCISGIVGPLVTKMMTHTQSGSSDNKNNDGWKTVFIVCAEIQVFGALVYFILAEGKRQWWAGGTAVVSRNRAEAT